MKKSIQRIGCIVFVLALIGMVFMVSGSGQSGDAKITSKWKISETMVNGNVTREADYSPIVRLFTSKDAPKFKVSKDGASCVLTIGQKNHKGTVTEEDGKYIIDFDDSYSNMIGEISGNKLSLTNEKGTVLLLFETK